MFKWYIFSLFPVNMYIFFCVLGDFVVVFLTMSVHVSEKEQQQEVPGVLLLLSASCSGQESW